MQKIINILSTEYTTKMFVICDMFCLWKWIVKKACSEPFEFYVSMQKMNNFLQMFDDKT
jgi:hypothetical protein